MSLPEHDPHVRFLIRDSWLGGFIVGWLSAGLLGVVGMLVVAYAS